MAPFLRARTVPAEDPGERRKALLEARIEEIQVSPNGEALLKANPAGMSSLPDSGCIHLNGAEGAALTEWIYWYRLSPPPANRFLPTDHNPVPELYQTSKIECNLSQHNLRAAAAYRRARHIALPRSISRAEGRKSTTDARPVLFSGQIPARCPVFWTERMDFSSFLD